MQVNIYGGSNKHPNNGSCSGIAQYLEHEKEGKFFSQAQDNTPRDKVIQDLDNNKAQLMKKDAKFFVIEVNPSKAELEKMGQTKEEREQALKNFVREDVIPEYAKNFNKGLTEDDIKYHAMIHHTRGEKDELQTHCHIIVSRKDQANKVKLSPMTTHRATTKGKVKGGFDRSKYFDKVEKAFDRKFEYNRAEEQKYENLRAIKRGTDEERERAHERIKAQEIEQDKTQIQEQNKKQEQQILQSELQRFAENQKIQQQMKTENEQQQEQQAQDQAQQRTEQQAHKLTLEERIEARREHYRKEGFPEQGIENMIQMELKYKMFDTPSKAEQQERERRAEQLRKEEQEREKKLEEKRNRDKGLSR